MHKFRKFPFQNHIYIYYSNGIPSVYFVVSVRQETNCLTLDELVLLVNVIDVSMIAGGFTSPW